MNKFTYCTSCKKEIKIKTNASTRPDLQMEKGSEFIVNCQNCGKKEKKHVNDIKADVNNKIIVIGVIVGVIISTVLFFYFGLIGALGFTIPLIFWQQQMAAKKAFNSYMIRRK